MVYGRINLYSAILFLSYLMLLDSLFYFQRIHHSIAYSNDYLFHVDQPNLNTLINNVLPIINNFHHNNLLLSNSLPKIYS